MPVPPILWQPSERAIEEAQVTQFARQVIRKHRLELNSYPEFHRWTVDNPEVFWSEPSEREAAPVAVQLRASLERVLRTREPDAMDVQPYSLIMARNRALSPAAKLLYDHILEEIR